MYGLPQLNNNTSLSYIIMNNILLNKTKNYLEAIKLIS